MKVGLKCVTNSTLGLGYPRTLNVPQAINEVFPVVNSTSAIATCLLQIEAIRW